MTEYVMMWDSTLLSRLMSCS